MKKIFAFLLFPLFVFAQFGGWGSGVSQSKVNNLINTERAKVRKLTTNVGHLRTSNGTTAHNQIYYSNTAASYISFPVIPEVYEGKSVTLDSLILFMESDQATGDSLNYVRILTNNYGSTPIVWQDETNRKLPNTDTALRFAPSLAIPNDKALLLRFEFIYTAGTINFWSMKIVYSVDE